MFQEGAAYVIQEVIIVVTVLLMTVDEALYEPKMNLFFFRNLCGQKKEICKNNPNQRISPSPAYQLSCLPALFSPPASFHPSPPRLDHDNYANRYMHILVFAEDNVFNQKLCLHPQRSKVKCSFQLKDTTLRSC